MAPIEPDLSKSNIRPLAIFGGYLTLAAALTGLISYNVLWKAFRSLPPSQDTRHRKPSREKHVYLFLGLAIASLGATWFYMFKFFVLSYRVWAYEMGEEVPLQLWGQSGVFDNGQLRLALGRWLNDTSLFNDAWEIVVEKSRRYWWSQQIFLGAAAWSVFVGVEGRRKNIRYLWAFLLLGQVVAISFAMNLFFLAILLTPVSEIPSGAATIYKSSKKTHSSSSDSTELTKVLEEDQSWVSDYEDKFLSFVHSYAPSPTNPHPLAWTPSPYALMAPLVALTISTLLLPFSIRTADFAPLLLIPHLALFYLVLPANLLPFASGSSTNSTRTYGTVYRFLAIISVLLHLKQTVLALLNNDPGAYDHRHSHYLASLRLPHEYHRSGLERSSSAVNRVLGALQDHPAVSSVGWDVLICAISLVAWSVVRGIEIRKILSAAGLTVRLVETGKRKPGHRRKGSSAATNGTEGQVKRRRRQSSKAAAGDADKGGDYVPDQSTVPVMRGGEEEDENLEAGALSWVMFAFGGLGLVAAGVLGGEFDSEV